MISAPGSSRKKISVLVVDDSTFMRKALKRMLSSDPALRVAGEAVNGLEAIEKVRRLKPDVMTLDVKMPEMNGIEALERIMKEHPLPVLMVSSMTSEGGELTLKALEMGAVDFIDKSSCHTFMDIVDIADSLVQKVKAVSGIDMGKVVQTKPVPRPKPARRPQPLPRPVKKPDHITVIGCSTGGPIALNALLPALPRDYPGAVLVVQHMPPGFTLPLSERLDRESSVPVREAKEDDPVLAGRVYIAPSGYHMKLGRGGGEYRIVLTREPRDRLHCPSVDVLMASVALAWKGRALGVVLTGMGSDGAEGIRLLKEAGGTTIAQDRSTSVIFGMPRVAYETGFVDALLPLPGIIERVREFS